VVSLTITTAGFVAFVKEKQTLKNTIDSEARFGLALNWAFIAQSVSRSLVIIVL